VSSVPAVAGSELNANFEFDMPLLPSGHYVVAVAVADGTQEDHVPLDWMHEALVFESHYQNGVVSGLVGIPMHVVSLDSGAQSAGPN
jgi:lipopolysaccharide transport system ATP-binding protein